MHFTKYTFLCLIVLGWPSLVKVQQYMNLTGSSNYAVLGKTFTWTCTILKPQNLQSNYVFFKRNFSGRCVGIQQTNGNCTKTIENYSYTYECVSENIYTLTIPANNMTEVEQNSKWHCESVVSSSFSSPVMTLKIAIEVYNITISPNDNPLTMSEGSSRTLECEVNRNALPTPTITWYLGSTNISSTVETFNKTTTITGSRTDDNKTLECRATNNNLPKSANTTLNIEYPPMVNALSNQTIIEGRNLTVNCIVTPGNPNSVTNWTKVDSQGFKQTGAVLELPNIQRASSGTYRCTATNKFSDGNMGIHSQTMVINVLFPPVVDVLFNQHIVEGKDLSVNCTAIPGNPNSTRFYWTKEDNPGFIQSGTTLMLTSINRTSHGTYICTAENNYNNSQKGRDTQSMGVNVQYPPVVKKLSQLDIIEGSDLIVTCQATPGNPNSTTFHWTKEGGLGFRENRATLMLFNIQRNNSGTYICAAENIYTNKEKGMHNETMVVNVQYQPTIDILKKQYVNESEKVTFIGKITSNPLANASWLNGTELLRSETSVSTASFTIENALCTDTKNFTVKANNGVGNADEVSVELFVNCKPVPDNTNITLGVTDTTGIDFSTTVIAYPEPEYFLEYTNGTRNTQMMDRLFRNAVNNFTVQFTQTVVNKSDYGTYNLVFRNLLGEVMVHVNVLPQRKPDIPGEISVFCEMTNARIQWISSFNGGDPQNFTVFAFDGQQEVSQSVHPDSGENKLHEYFVRNLQPSRKYTFYISALNKHGNSSSEEKSCFTSDGDSSLQAIAGGTAAGGITLAVIIIVCVVLLRRYMKKDKQEGCSQRLHQDGESDDTNDDGMRDNILYVSAGPKEDKKPEAAVYAAVNKKAPESNNNANNVYAEVKKGGHIIVEGALYSDVKPKRGLFKKDVSRKKDSNPKQKKGKKQKSKQDVADVYENSEDIAMSSKSDNVYSNSGQKVQNKEERGYKNKDGLLYVEVQFDATTEKGNKTIHGEDEKTDYATVEFPMAASIHDESEKEKI